jgi:integrase
LSALTPEWQTLRDRLRTPYESWGLSRLMRFCSSQGIIPDAVDQSVFDRFGDALAEESLVRNPRADHQTACRLWNMMRSRIAGWPAFEVAVPRYNRSYAVGWEECHPVLVSEVRAYLDHLAGTDLLAARPLTRPMSARSIATVEGDLKRFMGALQGTGVDVGTIGSLRDLVALSRVEQGLRWLFERNSKALNHSIGSIAWTLRCLAVKHLGVGEPEEVRFKQIVDRTRIDRRGLSRKNRELLEQFDDRRLATVLLSTPRALWEEAAGHVKAGRTMKAALSAQSAVLIELLIFAPMRLGNLASLDLSRHLSWIDSCDGVELHITIPAEEVKNRERLTYVLLPTTTQRVRDYVASWRPVLLGDRGVTTLFPGDSRGSGQKEISSLRKQIKLALRRHVGLSISPHQFRHIDAKLLLDARPGAYEVVRKLLGHKSVSTTYEHYAGGETKAAVQFHAQVILGYQNEAPVHHGRLRRGGKTHAAGKPPRRPVEPVRKPRGKRQGTWRP